MKLAWRFLQVAILLITLFVAFNWASLRLYSHYQFEGYAAVLGGMAAGGLLMFLLFTLMYKWIFGKLGSLRGLKWRGLFTIGASMAIVMYMLLHVSGTNTKADEVAREYNELHPVMRTSVGALVLLDRSLIVTDASRTPEDYDAMGLSRYNASKHFVQDDGYVHAVDIRTIGNSEARNERIEFYFRLLGFKTLRHVGTADHLHVEMPQGKRNGS